VYNNIEIMHSVERSAIKVKNSKTVLSAKIEAIHNIELPSLPKSETIHKY